MKIRTKLTLLIAVGMLLFGLLLIALGAAFSIHEVLLVKRHDLKDAARRIDVLLGESSANGLPPSSAADEIRNGLCFIEKKRKCLSAVVFDNKGRLAFADEEMDKVFDVGEYPRKAGKYLETRHWKAWNLWTIDFRYRGENCYVKSKLTQQLEIQEDLSLFFFGSLPVIAIISLLGGWLITNRLLARMRVIETAAAEIASGNLKYRIPPSDGDDELSEVESNLNHAFAKLEEYFTKIMEFSSDIAHELRTPLTVISGEVEVALRESRGKEEYQETLAGILDEVSTLRKIIDDMLVLVKPESAYSAVVFEKVDVSDVASDIADFYAVLAEAKGVCMETAIDRDVSVDGIYSLLRLVFANLIDNAIKFSPENAGGKVEVELKLAGDSAVFLVSNDGPPIPLGEREKIFTRFHRSESNRGKRGVGLGLAIVKKVCDIHGASIEVESDIDGNAFKVVFRTAS